MSKSQWFYIIECIEMKWRAISQSNNEENSFKIANHKTIWTYKSFFFTAVLSMILGYTYIFFGLAFNHFLSIPIDLIAFGAYTSIPKVAAAFVLCAEIPPTGRFYSSFVVSVRTKSACSLAYRQVRSVRSDKAKIKAACRVTLHTADKCCCKFGLRGTIRGR